MNEVAKHISDLCQDGIAQSLVTWYAKIKKKYPWRSLWEETKNPWAVWVSEIMLQQTVIAAVLHKYSLFMSRFPTVDSFAAASELEIRPFVSGLGYYRRFFLLHKGSKQVSQHGFPKTHAEWNQISGVGPYTSAAIASITLNEGVGVVDGNVERVLARVFEIKEVVSTPNWKSHFSSIMTFWAKCVKNPGDFNQAVMELGQSICSIKNPKCAICPISNLCKAHLLGTQQLCPKPKAPKKYLSTNIKVKIHVKGNQVFLAKRSERSLFLKGTYGFPFSEIQEPPIDANFLVKHSITKYRISAEICKTSSCPTLSGIWVARDQIEEKLISSLDQKIWKSFQKNT